MSFHITEYRPGEPVLKIIQDDYEVFSMTLGPVSRESHLWLGEILDRSFKDSIDRAVQRARNKDQAAMRKLMGIGS